MGGNVFTTAASPLLTPRMPPAVYFHMRARCHAVLSTFYTHLVTPVEAPEKASYGDIDILACTPLSTSSTLIADIARALSAARVVAPPPSSPADLPVHFALPWPTDLPDSEPTPADTERFVQLDLLRPPSPPALRYLAFTHAHSGLFTLLGAALLRAGLILTSSALSLRVPAAPRRTPPIPLSADPAAILDFLGMGTDTAPFAAPFPSEAAMFAYAASCRLFTTRPRADDDDASAPRKRLKKRRPAHARWLDGFVPAARAGGVYDRDVPGAEVVRAEAFARWPAARGAYEEAVREVQRGEREEEVVRIIAAEVPGDADAGLRGAAVKGLRRIVLEGDGSYGVAVPDFLVGGQGGWDEQGVRGFVRGCWREVGRVGVERGRARMVEEMEGRRGREEWVKRKAEKKEEKMGRRVVEKARRAEGAATAETAEKTGMTLAETLDA